MNSRMQEAKTSFLKVSGLVCGLAFATALSTGLADSEDHVVIVRETQSLEQIVEAELQSTRFARQIAAYNGIDTLSTIVPSGTALQIPRPYLHVSEFGRVVFSKGDVVHTQQRLVVNPPARGAQVYQGDTFATGSDGFVSLSFGSGAVVNLQPLSRVSIADIECADETVKCVIALEAEQGEVESRITPRPENQPPVNFTVKTPFLSAAVRGTAFYVNVEQGADKLGVTHGLVATVAGGTSNDLPEGKGLLAEEGSSPALVDLLAPPELSLGSERAIYSAEDTVFWKPLADAELYRLVVAKDPSLSQPVSVESIDGIGAPLQLDEPGQYYLSVAGIDAGEFLGLPATGEIKYASIDDEEKLELDIKRLDRTVDISAPDYSDLVELVISNSVDGSVVERRFVDNLSQVLSLELDPQEVWVFQARKILSDRSVSVYSNQYLLDALK